MPSTDFEIYDGKTFRDLCKEIVDRSQSKKDQVDILITEVRNHIKSGNDVQVYLPRIKELLDVGIKNDEQIVKLAAVLQRLQSTQIETGNEDGMLTDDEKERLRNNSLESLKEIKEEVETPVEPQPLFTPPA